MLRVYKTPAAHRDLAEIALHIADQNPDAALRLLDAAEETFLLLALSPLIGSPFPTKRQPNLRRMSVHGFPKIQIIYEPGVEELTIVRVVHGSRDFSNLFSLN